MHINLAPIVNRLDGKKEEFISKCRDDIERYVTAQERGALAIREIGVRVHYAAPDNYMKVLYKFCKRETYHNHELESVLSDPISELVVKNYKSFLDRHKAVMVEQVKQQVADTVNVAGALEQILADEVRKQGVKQVRHQAVELFVNTCQAAFHSHLASATSATVTHAVTVTVGATVGTTVGSSIAHALNVAIVHATSMALAHVGHSVAVKAVLHTVIAHSVGAIVTAVLVKMAVGHVTAASAGACLGPAVWLIGGSFVFYKILTIPDKLGRELGKALADDMRGNFRSLTVKTLAACFADLFDPEQLLKSVVGEQMDELMPAIIADIRDDDFVLPTEYAPVEKDIKWLVEHGENKSVW